MLNVSRGPASKYLLIHSIHHKNILGQHCQNERFFKSVCKAFSWHFWPSPWMHLPPIQTRFFHLILPNFNFVLNISERLFQKSLKFWTIFWDIFDFGILINFERLWTILVNLNSFSNRSHNKSSLIFKEEINSSFWFEIIDEFWSLIPYMAVEVHCLETCKFWVSICIPFTLEGF